jgi:hypothetical protein
MNTANNIENFEPNNSDTKNTIQLSQPRTISDSLTDIKSNFEIELSMLVKLGIR